MTTTISTVINGTGVRVPSQPFPADTIEIWTSGTDYICTTDADLHVYPPLTTPRQKITSVRSSSISISPDYFGMHVQLMANAATALREISFDTVRSHDSGGVGGCRWHTVNPSNGVFAYANPDAFIDTYSAAGKKVMLMLGFTPDWASATTPNTGHYDNGTTARATNQPPSNTAYWDAYVSAMVTRYLGKIQYLEIWNEVNYPSYWSGSAAQLAVLTRRASQVAKAIDPTIKIVGPIIQEPETGGTGAAYLASFLTASDGATGTGKDWIDICGVHMYPPVYNFQVHKNQYDNVLAELTAVGKGSLDIWNTETGVLQGTSIVDDVQAKWIKRSLALCAILGVRKYWLYAYDNTVMFMTDKDKEAYREARSVLLSGPISGCNIAPDGRVAFTANGVNYIW